jgi:hypothetical protein
MKLAAGLQSHTTDAARSPGDQRHFSLEFRRHPNGLF